MSDPCIPGPAPRHPPLSTPERVVESRELLGECGQLVIRHGGRLYKLKRTRLGKLILTA